MSARKKNIAKRSADRELRELPGPGRGASRAESGDKLWLRWRPLWTGAALVAMTYLAYWPALDARMNIFDDHDYILLNPMIRRAPNENRFDGLWKMWRHPESMPQVYPMTYTSYWVEYQLWGLEPRGYHRDNILIHALAAMLLWRLLTQLAVPGAWLAAAVYAVHPVCVESVAWVAERKNTLSMAFALASIMCYLRFSPPEDRSASSPTGRTEMGRLGYYAAAFVLFAAALFSKTSVLIVPAVLLVVFWWKRGRITARDVGWLVPFFALGIALGFFTTHLEFRDEMLYSDDWNQTPLEKLLIAGRALWFYAGKLAWPHPLIHFYPQWQIDVQQWWQYLFPLAALGTIFGLWGARNRVGRGPLAAVLIFAGVLAPGLGFFKILFMRHTFVADHFQYHACVALIALAAAGAALAAQRLRPAHRTLAYAAAGILLATLGWMSFVHARTYHDMATLQQDVIEKNPQSWISFQKLAIERGREGDYEEAYRLMSEALRLRPDDARNHFTMAFVQIKLLGRASDRQAAMDKIVEHFEEALRLDPKDAEARHYLALTRADQGRPDLAIEQLEAVLKVSPNYAEAREHLADLLAQQGDMKSARQHYADVASLTPNNAQVRVKLGTILLELGQPAEATRYLQEAIRLVPNSPETQVLLNRAKEMQRK